MNVPGFDGVINNIFFIDDQSCTEEQIQQIFSSEDLSNLNLATEVDNPSYNVQFDTLLVEWQEGGKYRGD